MTDVQDPPVKFRADWFNNGQEVTLPSLKLDGELAIAKLQAQHPEFTEYTHALVEQTFYEANIAIVKDYILVNREPGERDFVIEDLKKYGVVLKDFENDLEKAVRNALRLLKIETSDNLFEDCVKNIKKLDDILEEKAKATLQLQMQAQPVFIERSLLDAYYRLKQIDNKIKLPNGKVVPLTKDSLAQVITSKELADYFMLKSEQERAEVAKEVMEQVPDFEETKKK